MAAEFITDPANPRFAKAIVNRLWRRYLGLGLFEPIDDFRTDRPATNPELLDWLADDFMRSGYDLKHTIRLILNSRTYQLRYDPALEDHFDVGKPAAARYYRSPSLRKLTAEQLLDSLIVANTQKLDLKSASIWTRPPRRSPAPSAGRHRATKSAPPVLKRSLSFSRSNC